MVSFGPSVLGAKWVFMISECWLWLPFLSPLPPSPLSYIICPAARSVLSNLERNLDLCSAAVVLTINCLVWNVGDFPEEVLFEKCSLGFKDSLYSWQQGDTGAGSAGGWSGPLAVAELWKESIFLDPLSWPCPEMWGDVLDLSLLQGVQLQIVLLCNRTQGDILSFLWPRDAVAIQVPYPQPHRCSSDLGAWDPRCLNPLTWPPPYFW